MKHHTELERERAAEMNKALRQFTDAASKGMVHALDRRSMPIEEGDVVLFEPPNMMDYRVISVVPVLDGTQPPGAVKITLSVEFPVFVMANKKNARLVVLAKTQPAEKTGDQQPPADPPPVDQPPPDGAQEEPRSNLLEMPGAPKPTNPSDIIT